MEWGKVSKVVRLEVRHAVCSVFTSGDTGDGTQKVERCVDRWRRNLFLFLSQLSKNVDPNKLPCFKPSCFWRGREREVEKFRKKVTFWREGGGGRFRGW